MIVGVEEIAYAGNHGLELLEPGESAVRYDPAVGDAAGAARAFVARLPALELAELGLRIEDKGAIQAFHWRGAPDEAAAEARARRARRRRRGGRAPSASAAARCSSCARPRSRQGDRRGVADRARRRDPGAVRRRRPHRPRRVRGAAPAALERGRSSAALCVGVASEEAPERLWDESDAIVAGTAGFAWVLRLLAGRSGAERASGRRLMFYGDLLRLTVLLAGAVATALGAVAVVIANREVDETALIVAVAWWLVAAAGGLALGRSAAAAEEMSRVLAGGAHGDPAAGGERRPDRVHAAVADRRIRAPRRRGRLGVAAGRGDRRRLRDPRRAGACEAASRPSPRSRSATASASTSSRRPPSSP